MILSNKMARNYRGLPFNGCWEWKGKRLNGRYGQVWHDGRYWLVHRLVWTAFNEEIPLGINVCHSCDNVLCYRPDHLFLGTQKVNMEDMVSKGRQKRQRHGDKYDALGFSLPQTKLSNEDVTEIRTLQSLGLTQIRIVTMFGISQGHVSDIVRQKKRTRLERT